MNQMGTETFESVTKKITWNGHEMYVSMIFDRMKLAALTVKVGKYGSDLASFVNGWAACANVALSYGVPWTEISESAKVRNDPTMLHAVVTEVDIECELRRVEMEQHKQLELTAKPG